MQLILSSALVAILAVGVYYVMLNQFSQDPMELCDKEKRKVCALYLHVRVYVCASILGVCSMEGQVTLWVYLYACFVIAAKACEPCPHTC
jgi:hypothetical protein